MAKSYYERLAYSDVDPQRVGNEAHYLAGSPNAEKYAAALDRADPAKVEETLAKVRAKFNETASKSGNTPGQWAKSESWGLWDIGKQLHLHEEAQATGGASANPNYRTANPLTDPQLQDEIAARMVGFDANSSRGGHQMPSHELTSLGKQYMEGHGVSHSITEGPASSAVTREQYNQTNADYLRSGKQNKELAAKLNSPEYLKTAAANPEYVEVGRGMEELRLQLESNQMAPPRSLAVSKDGVGLFQPGLRDLPEQIERENSRRQASKANSARNPARVAQENGGKIPVGRVGDIAASSDAQYSKKGRGLGYFRQLYTEQHLSPEATGMFNKFIKDANRQPVDARVREFANMNGGKIPAARLQDAEKYWNRGQVPRRSGRDRAIGVDRTNWSSGQRTQPIQRTQAEIQEYSGHLDEATRRYAPSVSPAPAPAAPAPPPTPTPPTTPTPAAQAASSATTTTAGTATPAAAPSATPATASQAAASTASAAPTPSAAPAGAPPPRPPPPPSAGATPPPASPPPPPRPTVTTAKDAMKRGQRVQGPTGVRNRGSNIHNNSFWQRELHLSSQGLIGGLASVANDFGLNRRIASYADKKASTYVDSWFGKSLSGSGYVHPVEESGKVIWKSAKTLDAAERGWAQHISSTAQNSTGIMGALTKTRSFVHGTILGGQGSMANKALTALGGAGSTIAPLMSAGFAINDARNGYREGGVIGAAAGAATGYLQAALINKVISGVLLNPVAGLVGGGLLAATMYTSHKIFDVRNKGVEYLRMGRMQGLTWEKGPSPGMSGANIASMRQRSLNAMENSRFNAMKAIGSESYMMSAPKARYSNSTAINSIAPMLSY